MKKQTQKIGLYAGSFDPMTLGHLDILQRSCKLFDRVVVGVGENSTKASLFSLKERLSMVKESCEKLSSVEIATYKGLTVDFAKELGACALIRGVRTCEDLNAEMAMAQMNRHLAAGVETVFIPTNPEFFHISSSLVKDVARNGGDLSSLVPPSVSKRLAEKLRDKR